MSLSISINKPPGACYMPGESITGVVVADMDEPKSCECIYETIEFAFHFISKSRKWFCVFLYSIKISM